MEGAAVSDGAAVINGADVSDGTAVGDGTAVTRRKHLVLHDFSAILPVRITAAGRPETHS